MKTTAILPIRHVRRELGRPGHNLVVSGQFRTPSGTWTGFTAGQYLDHMPSGPVWRWQVHGHWTTGDRVRIAMALWKLFAKPTPNKRSQLA